MFFKRAKMNTNDSSVTNDNHKPESHTMHYWQAERIKELEAEVEVFKNNNRYHRGYDAGEKSAQEEVNRLKDNCRIECERANNLGTKVELLTAKIKKLEQELLDYSEDFAMLGLPHGSQAEKLLVLRDQARRLVEAADDHLCALLDQEDETEDKLEAEIKTMRLLLKP